MSGIGITPPASAVDVAALATFNVFAGPASGASVSVIAVARSDVSSN